MTAIEFLKRASDGKHRIVSSGDLHAMQISEAQADKRFFVDDQTGLGWALVPWELTTAKDRHREEGFFTRQGLGKSELTECVAERDGDCSHEACPQLKDRQPHCPPSATSGGQLKDKKKKETTTTKQQPVVVVSSDEQEEAAEAADTLRLLDSCHLLDPSKTYRASVKLGLTDEQITARVDRWQRLPIAQRAPGVLHNWLTKPRSYQSDLARNSGQNFDLAAAREQRASQPISSPKR